MQYENEHGYQLLNYFRLFSHVHVYHINSGTIQKFKLLVLSPSPIDVYTIRLRHMNTKFQ